MKIVMSELEFTTALATLFHWNARTGAGVSGDGLDDWDDRVEPSPDWLEPVLAAAGASFDDDEDDDDEPEVSEPVVEEPVAEEPVEEHSALFVDVPDEFWEEIAKQDIYDLEPGSIIRGRFGQGVIPARGYRQARLEPDQTWTVLYDTGKMQSYKLTALFPRGKFVELWSGEEPA